MVLDEKFYKYYSYLKLVVFRIASPFSTVRIECKVHSSRLTSSPKYIEF